MTRVLKDLYTISLSRYHYEVAEIGVRDRDPPLAASHTLIIGEDDDAIKVASTTSELTLAPLCVCARARSHGLTVW